MSYHRPPEDNGDAGFWLALTILMMLAGALAFIVVFNGGVPSGGLVE